jgi:phosphatidylglycerophosphate synthase
MQDVKKQERVHDMILGPLERPALKWLAQHTPRRFTPDTLTIIGILGTIVIFLGYFLSNFSPGFLWLASLGFVINWYGDSLDGTLARHRKIERPKFGFFLDHTVDAFSQILMFLGLGFSPYVRLDVACLALVGYLSMTILAYINTIVTGKFQISYAKIGPTEMRVLAVLINISLFFFGNPAFELLGAEITVFDMVVVLIAIALLSAFAITSLSFTRKLRYIDQEER